MFRSSRFYIYDLSKKTLQMNYIFAEMHNPIFDFIKNNKHRETSQNLFSS
jgi:hypothetical protein